MLVISGAATVAFPCRINVDYYVPLNFEAYEDVIPGPRLFVIGNRRSLLEMTIDPETFVLRGVTLVLFDRVLSPAEVVEPFCAEQLEGLPVVDPSCLPEEVTREHVDFWVALVDDELVIDWSTTPQFSQLIRYHSVDFYTAHGELRRIAFRGFNASERAILAEHVQSKQMA